MNKQERGEKGAREKEMRYRERREKMALNRKEGNIHRCPLNPGKHLHMKESRESLHSAPLAQGLE